jgi:uncharacterized protein (TIGR03437 family)
MFHPDQISSEIPTDAATGEAIMQAVRNGQAGNTAYLNIKDRLPQFITNGGSFAIMTTPDGTLTGIPTRLMKLARVVIYTIGLGPTSPADPWGTAPPASPLTVVTADAQACFGVSLPFSPTPCVTPQLVGLTPGFVGLYQSTSPFRTISHRERCLSPLW